jgi:hypothetical protein
MKMNTMIRAAGNGLLARMSERCKRVLAGVTALLIAGGNPAFADLNNGLVLHLPLSRNANDASAYGNHATMFGSLPFMAHPPFGMAGHFVPAETHYLEIPHQPQLVLTSSFSIQFWYRPTQLLLGARVLQKHVPADHTYGNTWDIAQDPADRLNFYHCWPGSPDNFRAVCPIPLAAGAWHHIVYTYSFEENTFRGYLNGALVAEETAQHQVVPLDTPLSILVMRDRGGWPSEGDLDEIRIYNRALSEAEIEQLGGSDRALIYGQSFASDTGWTTDDPVKLGWDSGTGTFRGTQVNTEGTYAYTNLPTFNPNESWRLKWDHLIISDDWSAGLTFGFFDSRLLYPFAVGMDMSIGDMGHGTALISFGTADSTFSPAWSSGVWYRNVLEYDAATHQLTLAVRFRENGAVFTTRSATVSSFPEDMTRLGVSRLMMKGSPPGASPWASVDYRLDNVSLWQSPPKGSIRFSQVEICWPSRTNVIYNVQCASSLSPDVWVDLYTHIVGAAGQTCAQDAIPAGQPQRFYRVLRVN